jgi:hypothetical protein
MSSSGLSGTSHVDTPWSESRGHVPRATVNSDVYRSTLPEPAGYGAGVVVVVVGGGAGIGREPAEVAQATFAGAQRWRPGGTGSLHRPAFPPPSRPLI